MVSAFGSQRSRHLAGQQFCTSVLYFFRSVSTIAGAMQMSQRWQMDQLLNPYTAHIWGFSHLRQEANRVPGQPACEPQMGAKVSRSPETHDVLIIGAGIAGLSAAYALNHRGIEPIVIEASNAPGGRMKTWRIGSQSIDTGAQFLSTGYEKLLGIAQEHGIHVASVPKSRTGYVVERVLKIVKPSSILSIAGSGLLNVRDVLLFGTEMMKDGKSLRDGALSNFEAWVGLDTISVRGWLEQINLSGVNERLMAPLLDGLYFFDTGKTSKALAYLVSAFSWRRHKLLAPVGGMAELPKAIAARLDVHYDLPVLEISDRQDSVLVRTAGGEFHAHHVICTTPAPTAKRLWRTAPQIERELMESNYSSTIVVAILTNNSYLPPKSIRDVYGILFASAPKSQIAAIALEHNKSRGTDQSSAFVIMLRDSAARTLMDADDDTILRAIREETELILGDVWRSAMSIQCTRWPNAMPQIPVGHALRVTAYRNSLQRHPRIILAGDFLGAPFTESACDSGLWAAAQIPSPSNMPVSTV
jgi:oxygen-dependent protoporphyrinogen oxidase